MSQKKRKPIKNLYCNSDSAATKNVPNTTVSNMNSQLYEETNKNSQLLQETDENNKLSFNKFIDLEDAIRDLRKENIELARKLLKQKNYHFLLQNKVKDLGILVGQDEECNTEESSTDRNSPITNTMLKHQINDEVYSDNEETSASSDCSASQLSEIGYKADLESTFHYECHTQISQNIQAYIPSKLSQTDTDVNQSNKKTFNELKAEVAYLREHVAILTTELHDVSNKVSEGNFKNQQNDVVADINVLNKKVDQCSSTLASVSKLVLKPDFEIQFNSLLAYMASTAKNLESYFSQLQDVSKVANRLDAEADKCARRYKLKVENLCPYENSPAKEMLLIFAESILGIKLEESDIENISLLKKTASTSEKSLLSQPLLVTFSCIKTRTRFYKSWLSYRDKNAPGSLSKERGQGLSVKEYLTKDEKKLYNYAINLKEKHKILDCWTLKGKTYVRKLDGTVSEFSNSDEIETKSEAPSWSIM